MKSEQEVRDRLKDIEEEVLIRIREGHPQVKLIDSGRIEMLNWVLEEPDLKYSCSTKNETENKNAL